MTKLNRHTCDCIVIGGGAAGMMSAVCASQNIRHDWVQKYSRPATENVTLPTCICRQTVIRTAILTLSCRF